MKTVKDIWMIRSGTFVQYFEDKPTAMLVMVNQEFLDCFPDNVVFTLDHGYEVVDYEPPTLVIPHFDKVV